MPIDLIQVPYDAGQRGVRLGRGPLAFVEGGAAERLRAVADDVREVVVEARPDFRAEIATAFELSRSTALAVRAARGRGSFPLVLAGNCATSLGVVASLGAATTGIVWLDAHGDLNTPETTTSGMLDGMALATLIGRCWSSLAATVDGFTPVSDDRVLLVGARDLDPGEERLLEGSRMMRVSVDALRTEGAANALGGRLQALAARVERVYLHVDLDVHDPAEARANQFAVPDGLTTGEVRSVVRTVASYLPVGAAALTAYDPGHDTDGRTLRAGLELMELIAELAA